jgi:DNA-binding PadR family transcriptional regulator
MPPTAKTQHFLMLLALLAGDAHGLAIAREVERLSEGRVRLWPATLYGALEDLVEYGWIEEVADPPGQESERKRYYRITRSARPSRAGRRGGSSELVRIARSRVNRGGRRR